MHRSDPQAGAAPVARGTRAEPPLPPIRRGAASLRLVADHAFSRAAGAPLVDGNLVRLLRDATENFPAWLAAIEGARRSIDLEAYIFADDPVGRRFAAALGAAARRGVRVRLLRDWFGGLGEARSRFWDALRSEGVEVRCFNPLRLGKPLGWLRRDHRKSIVVDGRVAFVTGLCIAARWQGDPGKGIAPWRDTGVELRGPAVADVARAFAETWTEAGGTIGEGELPSPDDIAPEGDMAVRVIATEPATAGVYRLDLLVAALARRTLWITDAYFVGIPSYVQALRAAALDGVDVRFLVPGVSDVTLVKSLSVAGYRPLLEAGVRVFEWNGPMLHAKTSVADDRWARVGSSNMNLSSWTGNWELDVAVEDPRFAEEMAATFEADLANATEVVLGPRRRRPRLAAPRPRPRSAGRAREGSALATAGALRLGRTVGAALGGIRVLGPAEARVLLPAGLLLVALAVLSLVFPRAAVVPLAAVGLWLGLALLAAGIRARRRAREERAAEPSRGDEPG